MLYLLLLTTYALPCLQHSRNLGPNSSQSQSNLNQSLLLKLGAHFGVCVVEAGMGSARCSKREREGKSERGVERYTNSDRRTRLQNRSGVLEQTLRSGWEEVRPNTWPGNNTCTWFGEVCICCSVPLLPQLACSIHLEKDTGNLILDPEIMLSTT